MNKKQWSIEEEKYISKNINKLSSVDIAKKLNRTPSSVRCKERRMGLIHLEKNQLTRDYFHSIDNEFKAYWLGFLMADGWISASNNNYEVGVELQIGDIEHLRMFNKCLSGNLEVKIRTRNNNFIGHNFNTCIIRIYSKQMYDDLFSLGFNSSKSFNIKIPKNIDKNMYKYIIRGYFDGNGCVRLNKERKCLSFDFCSASIDILNDIREILYNNNINSYIVDEKDKKTYRLYIKGMYNSYKFYKYIYDNADIYLKRKYIKSNNIINNNNITERINKQVK